MHDLNAYCNPHTSIQNPNVSSMYFDAKNEIVFIEGRARQVNELELFKDKATILVKEVNQLHDCATNI